MDNDLINSQATGPIVRSTDAQRLATFQANSNSIYNKFTPFTTYSFGPSQPFIYTKVSDSTFFRNLTKYDSQVAPIGSTVRDVKRIGQYLVTGNGLLFVGKQLLLQQQNAFNETRIYNPLSVLKATLKPGSLGAIDYPKRHLETSGGLLNFFKDALLSTIGYETKDAEKPRIDGTATGDNGVPYSVYVGKHGGARAGLLRFNTANKASSNFNELWVSNTSSAGSGVGFLANLGNALVNKLKSFIPSTNPLGAFGGTANTWVYRPEYSANKEGIYFKFKNDASGFLSTATKTGKYQQYYNGPITLTPDAISKVSAFHKYSPDYTTTSGGDYPTKKGALYAGPEEIAQETVGFLGNNILTKLNNIVRESATDIKPQLKRSAEMYTAVKDYKGVSYGTYEEIPASDGETFSVKMGRNNLGSIEKDNWFAKSSGIKKNLMNSYEVEKDSHDRYNALDVLDGKRNETPDELNQGAYSATIKNQSRDLIYFFFFDLINNKYIPFRATLSSVSDQHTGDWEDVSYLGRADKLFLYKGFSRDVSFGFRVYANSAKEMIPMWNRINYLVGLTRPSKYTPKATVTNEDTIAVNEFANELGLGDNYIDTSGRESRFIYPPMVTLTMGDLYVDQPCVLSSVSLNIPDDSLWESQRDDHYSYTANGIKTIELEKTKTRQLPTIVDVSVNIKMLEKRLSLGSDAHFGRSDGQGNRWIL